MTTGSSQQPAPERQTTTEHPLPESSDGFVTRMAERTQAFGQDVVSFVGPSSSRTTTEREGEQNETVNAPATSTLVGALLTLGGLLLVVVLLIAAAFGLGEWLGHAAWGFLIVSIVFAAVGFALSRMQPNASQVDPSRTVVEEKKLTPEAPQERPVYTKDKR